MIERYIKKNTEALPELKHDEIGYSEIVQKKLGGLVEDDLYDHHNTWKAYSQFVVADLNPTKLEIDSLYYAYKSALGLSAATLTLLKQSESFDAKGIAQFMAGEVSKPINGS